MEMVERVARAMFATDWPRDDWDRFAPGDVATNRYLAMAGAAIAAMREPDHDMTGNVLRPGEDRTFLVSLWERMIDGALDEPEPAAALSPSGEK